MILDKSVESPIREETVINPIYRDSYNYQESVLIDAPQPHFKKQDYYSYRNPPLKNISQSLNPTILPYPCTNCEEWGHDTSHCNGPGNNGAFGRKYAPIYCTNCEEWAWHGRNNRNCPTNQASHNSTQVSQAQE